MPFAPFANLARLFLFVFLGFLSSCSSRSVINNEQPIQGRTLRANPDQLAEGDLIVITYAGIPTPPPPHTEQIQQDGSIHPPFLSEPVRAADLTTGELRERLMARYVPKIFTRISLTVKVEGRYFNVDGEVMVPGLHPYVGIMTVLDGIASAKGLNDFANKKRIRITRADGRTETFNYNKARDNQGFDIPLYPGDIIHVPRRLY